MKSIVAIALAFASVGCASRPFVLDVGVPLRFEAAAPLNEARQARPGDILFEQNGVPIEAVKLDAAVEQNVPVRKDGWHRVPAGTALFRVYGANQTAATYCTGSTTFTAIMPIGGTYYGHTCFTDTDGDKAFDQVWVANTYVVSEIQAGMWNDGMPLDAKVRYSPADPQSFKPVAKGVMYYKGDSSGARLQLFYRLEDEPRPINDAADKPLLGAGFPTTMRFVGKNDTLPKVVELAGARIEVQALKDGVMTYRTLSGMSNEPQPMMFAHLACDPQDPKNREVCEFKPFTPPR